MTNFWTGLLGSGALFTVILGVYDRIRNRKFEKTKQVGTIKLDEATYKEIASRAETVSDNGLMAVGAFWQGQFSDLSKQFEEERLWRRRATERWRLHRMWDEELIRKLEANSIHMEQPPSLDPDDPY